MPDLSDLLEQHAASLREGIRVAVTGTIVSYARASRTCSVLPDVQESAILGGVRQGVAAPTLEGVPVLWPGGGGRRFEWDLIAGDRVLVLIRSVSHDEVDDATGAVPLLPRSARRMDYSDAIVLPGFEPPGDPPAAPSNGQPWLTLGGGEALHVGGATYTLVRSDKLSDLWGDLVLWLASHTHSGVTTGPGVSAVPVQAATVPTTSIPGLQSSRVKTDA